MQTALFCARAFRIYAGFVGCRNRDLRIVNPKKLDAVRRTAEEVTRRGGTGLGLQLEVREKAQWQRVRQTLQEAWGGIDILVNNAGVADANKLVDMSDDAWDSLLSTNLDGVINGCRTYGPDMIKQKSGYILNVASVAGLLAMPEMANYSVSKAGVMSLSETLAAELAGTGINVTSNGAGLTTVAVTGLVLLVWGQQGGSMEATPLGVALALFALAFVPRAAEAQTGKISGTVTDAATGQPLEGVSVFLQGTGAGALTNASGRYFILSVPPGTYTIVVHSVEGHSRLIRRLVVIR